MHSSASGSTRSRCVGGTVLVSGRSLRHAFSYPTLAERDVLVVRWLRSWAMLCGVRVDWPNDFVEKQKAIAKDPTRAQSELLFLHGKLHVIDAERHSLHRASKKAERRCLALERQRDEQCMHAQRSEHAQWVAEENFKGVEALRTVIEKKLKNLEHERDSEKVRADHLQRQLSKLQGEARQSHRSVRAALQKLTRSPAVAKRIAAACHPDKCPPELSEVASELFRFVQSNREASEG